MWVHLSRFCSKLGRSLGTSSSIPLRNAEQEVKQIAKPPSKTKEASAVKDIIIFRYENPRFFKYLSLFAVAQFGFWSYLSTTFLTMIDVPVRKEPAEGRIATENSNVPIPVQKSEQVPVEDLPFWRKINLGTDAYKYGLCIGSFLMGYGILAISWTYVLRSVRYLVLRKDRKHVSFITYDPFGKNRMMDVPLDCVSAAGSRAGETSQLPVKVKNYKLFYILDLKQGQFPQPQLFDQTVGLKRKFK